MTLNEVWDWYMGSVFVTHPVATSIVLGIAIFLFFVIGGFIVDDLINREENRR